ncbi:MAG: 50S ribosomal protein L10 [Proteobacteria bacterium]|nr:50S ribosomal protein L10 [Pseudomonadota bacterium]MCH8081522.1 50S ribosomal protein L10 [Pseudomonadota bacterium]MCH8322505.1 50S ribosomal protein L10 [Pseudomonadota bacterium]
MDRAQKQELVSKLSEVFSSAGVVVVTHYSGLDVAKMTDLRSRLRENGASFKVTKNRLTKLALAKTDKGPLSDLFTGPTGIGYSDDPVAAPKVLVKFAKENDNLIILGGMMGEMVLDENAVRDLAALPSLDELHGKLVSLLSAPATKIAGVLQAPAGQLARVFGAYGAIETA